MELNGLVNIKLIISRAILQNTDNCTLIYEKVADQILEQVDYLERYMLAIQDACGGGLSCIDMNVDIKKNIPAWHDIKATPWDYPTMMERLGEVRRRYVEKD